MDEPKPKIGLDCSVGTDASWLIAEVALEEPKFNAGIVVEVGIVFDEPKVKVCFGCSVNTGSP